MRKDSGLTPIEVLMVVATVGTIAAIVTPSLLNAIDRGEQKVAMADMRSLSMAYDVYSVDNNRSRQKRTVAEMRSIAMALEAYLVDNNYYPVQTTQGPLSPYVNSMLTPKYTKVLPTIDGWNWQIQYGSSAGGGAYTIRSYGKDGIKNGTPGATTDFNCDIVFRNGQFTSYPLGIQT